MTDPIRLNDICYPVYASDYLDLSGYAGNSSVAGIVDNQYRVIAGYDRNYTYEEAKAVADAMNAGKSDVILSIAPKGTALPIRTGGKP